MLADSVTSDQACVQERGKKGKEFVRVLCGYGSGGAIVTEAAHLLIS